MMYIKLVCIYIYNFIDSFIYFLKLIYLFIYLEYIYMYTHNIHNIHSTCAVIRVLPETLCVAEAARWPNLTAA